MDTRGRFRRARSVALVLAAALAWPGPTRAAEDDATARLAALLAELARAPDDVDKLAATAAAAEAAGRADDALFLLYRAHRTAALANAADPRLDALGERIDALDPIPAAERPALDAEADVLREMGRVAMERRLYVNAVQLLARLEGSRSTRHADALLEKLFRDRKAVGMLLDSSVPVPATATFERIARKGEKEEAKHRDWSSAWEIATPNYVVRCNDGFDVATRVSTAMERINALYRGVFHHADKRKGEKTKTCTVKLHATRAEYLLREKGPDNALAFYSPADCAVVAYDPRSDGSPLASLWSTLFHEASHQFTDLISTGPVPSWLNEGTASYFEGARLRVDGGVETNRVPMERLTDLAEALQTGTPSLRDVISYEEPGSYPAEYYPTGWGLVYFLRNYEDADGELVYLPHYDAIVDSYRSGAAAPASFERFVQHVVTAPNDPEVTNFEDFEVRFRNWILDLYDLHAGPPDRARSFVERGRRQLEQKHADRAEESFRAALEKASDHVGALLALADLATAAKRKDEAIARLREIVEQVTRHGDGAAGMADVPFDTSEALAAEALRRIEKLDAPFAGVLRRVDPKLAATTLDAAERYRAAGFPRNAVRILREASALVDGRPDLDMEAQRIVDESALHVLVWRALDVPDDLAGWWHSPAFTAEGGVLTGAMKTDCRAALYEGELPARYRFEATLEPLELGEESYYGLVFGVDPDGAWDIAGIGGDSLSIDTRFNSWSTLATPRGLSADEQRSCRVAVEVRPGRARFYVNGELAGEQDYPPGALRGGIGLLVADAKVRFRDLRVAW